MLCTENAAVNPMGLGRKMVGHPGNLECPYRRVTKRIHILFKKACFDLCRFKLHVQFPRPCNAPRVSPYHARQKLGRITDIYHQARDPDINILKSNICGICRSILFMRNVKDFMEKVKREKISIVGAQTFGGLPGNGYADIFFFF